jgi:hypothetical protein
VRAKVGQKVYSDQPIANAQLAFGGYTWDEPTGIFMPHDVMVLTLRGAEIEEITAFLTPDAFAHFRPAAADPSLTAKSQERTRTGLKGASDGGP